MLFDCVRVNTGLGFHWICNREKKGRLYAPVGRFWLVNTYPCGCHPSVLSHHALGTAECDESNDGGDHIWSSGCGEFFYHESYCDESVVMTIYEFQIFLVTSVPGWGYALIGHMGGVFPYMGTPQRRGFLGCIKLITPYYWHTNTLCMWGWKWKKCTHIYSMIVCLFIIYIFLFI